MRRALLPTAALALTVPTLTSCGLLGGGGHLDDALDALPEGATQVQFVDREAQAERLGIEDSGVDDYVEKVTEDAVGGSPLASYLRLMADGAAFDERDVVWSATATLEGGPVSIYQLDDDVDLDVFAEDLLGAGLTEDDLRGRRHLQGDAAEVSASDGLVADAYPPLFFEVTIDEDEHLVVVGTGAEEVFETLDGDRDSLTDSDTFDEVLGDLDDVQYADLDSDPQCGDARVPPEQRAELGVDDLAEPSASAFVVSGEDATQTARLQFDDDDAAAADLDARTAYLEDGLLLRTRTPFSEYGDADLERDGSVVQVDLDLDEPRTGPRMAADRDGFLACSSAG